MKNQYLQQKQWTEKCIRQVSFVFAQSISNNSSELSNLRSHYPYIHTVTVLHSIVTLHAIVPGLKIRNEYAAIKLYLLSSLIHFVRAYYVLLKLTTLPQSLLGSENYLLFVIIQCTVLMIFFMSTLTICMLVFASSGSLSVNFVHTLNISETSLRLD